MMLEAKPKEIEITIKLNEDEADTLCELILFAQDFDVKFHRFTDSEKEMADKLVKFLESGKVL